MYDVYLLGLLGNGYHNMDQLRTKLTKVIMDQTTIHTNVASDYWLQEIQHVWIKLSQQKLQVHSNVDSDSIVFDMTCMVLRISKPDISR